VRHRLIAIAGLFLEEMIKTIIVLVRRNLRRLPDDCFGSTDWRVRRLETNGEFVWDLGVAGQPGSARYGIWPLLICVARRPQDPWYRNYGMIVGTVAVVGTGLLLRRPVSALRIA